MKCSHFEFHVGRVYIFYFNFQLFLKFAVPVRNGLLIARGDDWKRIRNTITPTFSGFKLKQVVQQLLGVVAPMSRPSFAGEILQFQKKMIYKLPVQ